MKTRAIKRYMRLAYFIGTDDNPCYSRKIGAVITTEDGSRILGTGYNGPPPGTPHTVELNYVTEFLYPKLTDEDKRSLVSQFEASYYKLRGNELSDYNLYMLLRDNPQCPRKLLDIPSGQRNNLCTCGHAERHAVTNAACDLRNAVMFCWCGVPCAQCADTIIQSGIKTVHCLNEGEYDQGVKWLFKQANVTIYEHDKLDFLKDG